MDQKPIISVKEARKLLGKEAKSMTDGEVARLIEDTHELAKLALQAAIEKVQMERKELLEWANFLYSRYLFHKAK